MHYLTGCASFPAFRECSAYDFNLQRSSLSLVKVRGQVMLLLLSDVHRVEGLAGRYMLLAILYIHDSTCHGF